MRSAQYTKQTPSLGVLCDATALLPHLNSASTAHIWSVMYFTIIYAIVLRSPRRSTIVRTPCERRDSAVGAPWERRGSAEQAERT